MTLIAKATVASAAAPAGFFARWADMATWPEWNTDTEWVRLDDPFAVGATGVLKPKGGPKVPFTITELTDTSFVDVSKLAGARLTFDHRIEPSEAGCTIDVTVTMDGPLGWLWTRILGKGLKASVQRDLDGLVAVVEAASSNGD